MVLILILFGLLNKKILISAWIILSILKLSVVEEMPWLVVFSPLILLVIVLVISIISFVRGMKDWDENYLP